MGMKYHGFNVTVALNDGKIINAYFGLDNEESVQLSKQAYLFKNAKTIADIQCGIEEGFVPTFDDLSFMQLFEELGDIDYYEDFLFKLHKENVGNIRAVILIADEEGYGERKYSWKKYELNPYKETGGIKTATYDQQKRKYLPEIDTFLSDELITKVDLALPRETKKPAIANRKCKTKDGMSLDEFGKLYDYFLREKDEVFFGIEMPRGIVIRGYKGNEINVVIPEFAGGYKINHIASFGKNALVENCSIPSGVGVSEDAFEDCPKLYKADANGYVVVFGRLVKAEKTNPKMMIPKGTKSIGKNVFSKNTAIEEVVLPDGLEEIAFGAFEECTSLKKVNFPNSLKTIEGNAFKRCTALTEVVFPENLETIGNRAFDGCKSISKVSIAPKTKCGSSAFSNCSKSLARADGITCVGGVMYDLDFSKHMSYHGVAPRTWHFTIPEDVKRIDGDIIFNAPGNVAESFTITDNIEYINTSDFFLSGVELFRIVDHATGDVVFETGVFADCPNLLTNSERFEEFCDLIAEKDYDALQELFSVGRKKKAAKKAASPKAPEKRTEVIAPAPQQTLETNLTKQAKKNCVDWMSKYGASITANPTIIFSGKTFVLSGISGEIIIDVEKNITERGGVIRQKVSGKTDYVVVDPQWAGESKTKNALEQQEKGTSVIIALVQDLLAAFNTPQALPEEQKAPKTMDKKTAEKKNGTKADHKETQPASRKTGMVGKTQKSPDEFTIFGTVFSGYAGSSSVVAIPDGITEISMFAFKENKNLRAITVPSSVKIIDAYAFSECEALGEVLLCEGIEEIGFRAFAHSGLKTITIPASIKKLDNAFAECDKLEQVAILASIQKLETSTFFKCKELREIRLPDSIRRIGENVFYRCISLNSITLPKKLRNIGKYAFASCEKLEQIVIPINVESIGDEAFCGCKELKHVHLSQSVKKIGKNAFSSLAEEVTFHTVPDSYGEQYCKDNHLKYDYNLDSTLVEQLGETLKKQVAEAERKRRDAEEVARFQELQRARAEAEAERKRKEEEEYRRRAAEEAEVTERRRQEQLAAVRVRYEQLTAKIAEQEQIIDQNKGWFGIQAKNRKAAQEQLRILQAQLAQEFPKGKP